MKTAVVMKRDLLGMDVRQDSKTKMFNANDLLKVGNEHRKNNGLSKKQLASFFDLDSTRELINAICLEDNISIEQVKLPKRGKNGGTWVHPILFVDMAMWYSPILKVRILGWVIDGLLNVRSESGDSFKVMCSILSREFPTEFNSTISYMKVANQIASACKVGTQKNKWQTASEDQLILRDKIQENITLLADMSPNVGTCVSKSISKALLLSSLKIEID
jgi:hypothetical protein